MLKLRATKYDPKNRSEDGIYLVDEWTSVVDVGTEFPTGVLTVEAYVAIENAYVETVLKLMHALGLETLKTWHLEGYFCTDGIPQDILDNHTPEPIQIREGLSLDRHGVDYAVRQNLRNTMWCCLVGEHDTYVHFGDDYYMYLGCNQNIAKECLETQFMYLEEYESPIEIDPDEDDWP